MIARRLWSLAVAAAALAALPAAFAGKTAKGAETEEGEDRPVRASLPTLEDLGYFLSRLEEKDKGQALNVLADLASESRIPATDIGSVLHALVDEGNPPEAFGYGCPTCFQKRLSILLSPLRLKGPRVNPPQEGLVVLRLDDALLRKIQKEAQTEFGGTVPGLAQAMLKGWSPAGRFVPGTYVRYHEKGGDPKQEPAFFLSGPALMVKEGSLTDPLDAWALSEWACEGPPRNRFDPGFLILGFDPNEACQEVRIPTAADSEDPYFRPSPASERQSGFTCGGAPQWVCPNIPLTAIKTARYVPNRAYLE